MSNTEKILNTLNPEQKKAVKAINGPVLILAGAGSGKTRCLTHRIAYLIAKGIKPSNILAVTFTNKAAEEMKNRALKLVSSAKKLFLICTFHALCVRILRQEAAFIRQKPNFIIYDQDDQQKIIRKILKDLELDSQQFKPASVLSTISSAKNQLLSFEDFQNQAQDFYQEKNFLQEKIGQIYQIYQENLKKINAFDFDDLIMKTVELFQKNPNILEKYQNRFQYILVDEYQDTNHAQYTLIHLLAKKYQNICVVGDDAQSIYGWRGANIENILNFQKDFLGAKVYLLQQNYRSTKKILKTANCIISKNNLLKPKKLWTKNQTGEQINILQLENEEQEANYIVDEISDLIKRHNLKLSDFSILYRTNTQSRALEEAFLSYNMAYKIIGGIKFYARKEVKDALAHLNIILNPKDQISFQRIGKRASAKLLKELARIKLKEKSVNQILDFALNATGYLNKLKLQDERKNEEKSKNVKELFTVIKKQDKVFGQPGLKLFLEKTSLASDLDEIGFQNAVHLMTLHAAKGLEFPVIFIAGFEDGIFPHSRSLDKPSALEEERRLCYVGVTRAREYLYLTFVNQRNIWGQTIYSEPSRFLRDIPEYLINFMQL